MMPESENKKLIIPLFPLPEVVLFPGMNLPLHIFEERYKQMISSILKTTKQFGIVLLVGDDCARVGTLVEIVDVENLEEGEMNIVTEGKFRFNIVSLVSEEPYYVAEVQPYEDIEEEMSNELKKTMRHIKKLSNKAISLFDKVSDQELSKKLKLPEDPTELLYLITANLTCTVESKQQILESRSLKARAEKVQSLLDEEIQKLEVLLENKKTKEKVVKNGKLKI